MTDAIENYINSLEGKTEVDPLAVARDLRELHIQEISTREAKIAELTGDIATKDTTITERDGEIQQWKAKNFDLAMQIPGASTENKQTTQDGEKPNGATITTADLFSDKTRKSNYLLRGK